jgi:hypothetical protein
VHFVVRAGDPKDEDTGFSLVDYNLAFIETDFAHKKSDLFDPKCMRALFDYSYEKGRRGYAWHKQPPNFEIARQRPAFEARRKNGPVSESR